MTTYSVAADFDFFNECLDELTINLVKNDLDVEEHGYQLDDFGGGTPGTVEEEVIKKALT